MDVELDAGGFKDFQTRYETLRQNHLDGVGGWAMSIFLREGMCGWILAWKHSDLDAGGKKAPKKNLINTFYQPCLYYAYQKQP
jgi:hypothetical protein